MLPLVRRLSQKVAVDLYIIVYGDSFSENVSSFDLSDQPVGLLPESTTKQILDERLLDYLHHKDARLTVRLFKYPNLKIVNRQNFRLHRALARTINQWAYDVVHFNGYRGSLLFVYAFLNRRVAKVWAIHDPILHSGEDKWQTRLGYSSYRFLKAHFILHNQSQREEFLDRYRIKPNHCHFVRFGPLDIFRMFQNETPEPTRPRTVLFWGRVSPYKGVEYLIEAGKMACQQLPDLKIMIAGKPNYAIDLEAVKQDSTFEVVDRFISNEELVAFIERAALIVCPYTDATQSGVIMTAYAFYKPVLATRVGGLPEVVKEGETGELVPPRDAQALASAIVSLLSDNKTLSDMQQNIRAASQTGVLSWNNIADQTIGVYQQAMAT
jgi:glycosyltransferase involved in cell wall biosynthesis